MHHNSLYLNVNIIMKRIIFCWDNLGILGTRLKLYTHTYLDKTYNFKRSQKNRQNKKKEEVNQTNERVLTTNTDCVHVTNINLFGRELIGRQVIVLSVQTQLLGIVGAPAVRLSTFVNSIRHVRIRRNVHNVLELVDFDGQFDVGVNFAQAQRAVAMRAHRVHKAQRVQEKSVMHAAYYFNQRSLELEPGEHVRLVAVLAVLYAQLIFWVLSVMWPGNSIYVTSESESEDENQEELDLRENIRRSRSIQRLVR
ncbi:hypothetical protein BpHYR1_033670 [Brachionus plicatilis]|uniref:Uncharacterized protein n=1 Tax=Brachionus plicatilis TaxID=10195 RepID=A0A3M7QPU1_BRAPC|nr:hypothetical protein BpHYR1_033670 [Brachionus plicatilis]